jgi:hypothetical protein
MCDLCGKVEEHQPNLGPGAFLAVTNATTGISADFETGIRISQERDVSYVGPQGNENRHEVESLYLRWDEITDFVINLIATQYQAGKEHE